MFLMNNTKTLLLINNNETEGAPLRCGSEQRVRTHGNGDLAGCDPRTHLRGSRG